MGGQPITQKTPGEVVRNYTHNLCTKQGHGNYLCNHFGSNSKGPSDSVGRGENSSNVLLRGEGSESLLTKSVFLANGSALLQISAGEVSVRPGSPK